MTLICKQCGVEVASRAALVEHWKEQREQGKEHYHCTQCMMVFHASVTADRHQREFHAAKQDLECPGCNERFLSVSSLVGHIEKSRCTRIGKDEYVARREEKLAFMRELQRREFENPTRPVAGGPGVAGVPAVRKAPYNFTQYLSLAKDVDRRTPSDSATPSGPAAPSPKTENIVRPKVSGFPTKEAEFPQLGNKLSDLSISGPGGKAEKQPASAWATKKNLFPDAPAPVRPAQGKQDAQQPVEAEKSKWSEHDPRNPGWDARKYYVTYLDKYKCPHDRCPKSFPREAGLRGHLSSSHIGQHKVQCPRCFKWFNSMTAITAHAESQSARCDLRWTNGYRELIDQMTAGIVDTAGKHEDGTVKYTVPDTARQYFGTSQGKWAAEQRNQQDGWGSNKAEGGSDEQAPKQD